MKLSYVDIFEDGERVTIDATITTEHPASHYGQPVILRADDGEMVDGVSWALLGYRVEAVTPDELALLRRIPAGALAGEWS